MRHVHVTIAGLFLYVCATLAGQQPARPSSSGVYTAAQAAAGEKVYFEQCASCHGDDLGGRERAPAIGGAPFIEAWSGRDLRQLLDRIDAMPPSAPKSLSPADAVAVLAFLLRDAQMPSGPTTLPTARDQLARITFERAPAAAAAVPAASPRGGGPPPAGAAPAAQGGRQGGRQGAPAPTGPSIGWTTYGANLASHRYSAADQVTKDNFNRLGIAWRLKTDFLGPRPDTLYSATPLVVDRTLYTTAGTRRAVIALDAVTGEMRWMHSEDEGVRGQNAPRTGAGRGLAYWGNGNDRRIVYVTPGYRMLALDARTGNPITTFGTGGAVDLKLEANQEVDLDTTELGLNATPLVVGDVVVVGVAHRAGTAPRTMRNAKGLVRGYDVRTGRRLWSFNTLPRRGEFGYDTWLENSAEYQRKHWRVGPDERRCGARTGLRPGGDAHRRLLRWPSPGRQPVRRQPGRAGRQDGKAEVAFPDRAPRRVGLGPSVRTDSVRHAGEWPGGEGRGATDQARVPVRVQPRNGRADLADRRAPRSAVGRAEGANQPDAALPHEARPVRSAGHQRERSARPHAGAQGRSDRSGEALQDGAAVHAAGGQLGRRPAGNADAAVRGGWFQLAGRLIRFREQPPVHPLSRAGLRQWAGAAQSGAVGHELRGGQARGGGAGAGGAARGAGPGGRGAAGGGGRGGTVQGLPLIKPPYDQITAYDMNRGEIVWQKTHSSTPDDIRNHPALKGLTLPRLGQPGRTFIGTLTTRNLLIAGEGGMHTNAAGRRISLLRAYDKLTGEDVGAVEMPAKQTGSPISYQVDGRQFIVLAVSGNDGAELLAFALP